MNLSGKNNSNPASELEQNLEFLRQTYFFSGIPLEALKVFAYLCTRAKFKAGEYLFRQGEDDGQAFYIIEGKAVLEYERSGETTRVRDCDPGEFLGGLTLVGELRRLFSLKASTDTICLILNREKFTKALEQFQDLMPKIFKALVTGIDNWEERFLANRTDKCGDCMEHLGVSLL
jgi:CRP-like cAMP-binding protein